MFKIVKSAVLAVMAMACFSSIALAVSVPDEFVGKWKGEHKDDPKDKDKVTSTYHWTITAEGKVLLEKASVGDVTKTDGSVLYFHFKNGDYAADVDFDRLTNVGHMTFTASPGNSPKQKNPGPYDFTMTKE